MYKVLYVQKKRSCQFRASDNSRVINYHENNLISIPKVLPDTLIAYTELIYLETE